MRVCVIGDGSWGTALACVLADAGNDVCILCRRDEMAESINSAHRNREYLKDAVLPDSISATCSYTEAFDGTKACVFVTPSKYLHATADKLAPYISDDIACVICSKGVEAETGKLPAEVLGEVLGRSERIAVLSGPTHAEEVVRRIPTGAVIASVSEECSQLFQNLFKTNYFRTYTSGDVVGVELCAAFKNVIAIAVGISYGIGFGDNTAAMLMTRGLAEMSRMVKACGGFEITCLGLAGAGDMIVTCTSQHSRNRRFGEKYVAAGKTLEDFESDTHMVVEGALACKTLQTLSRMHGVDLPLTDAIEKIVWQGAAPMDIASELVERPLKDEFGAY